MDVRWPHVDMLDSYVAALRRGWSPNTIRPEAAQEHLDLIGVDAGDFLESLVDREAAGAPILLPDGRLAERLPGFTRWMWDGEFCGAINLRYRPGTSSLPSHCLGHVGYSVVAWKQRRGYATSALASILLDARAEGLESVTITTDLDNLASQKVVESNGGRLVGEFHRDAAFDIAEAVSYEINLAS